MSRLVKIGLFVTITSVGTIVYLMQTAENVGTGRTYTVHAYIDDASGLLIDSNVKLAGVDVGRLTDIQLDGDRARLTLEIREDVELYEDAEVAKLTESMLGTATVSLTPGAGQGAMLTDGDVVRNVRSRASISDAVASANTLASSANDLVQQINRYVGDEDTVRQLNEIVAVVRETAISTSQLLEQNLLIARSAMENIQAVSARLDANADAQLRTVEAILDSTASLTARLDAMVDDNDESIGTSIRSIETGLSELRAVLASLESGAGNVEEITRRIRDGEGNVGRLLAEDQLYDRVVRVTEKAEEFIDSTIGLDVQVNFSNDYLIAQQSNKSAFDIRLTPARDDRYYRVGVISTPVPVSTTTTTERVVSGTSAEDTTTVETERREQLRLNLQLARIWGPLTVRAGVLEGSAGVGMDLQPIDRISLTAEAFEFGAEDGAYLRGYGTLYPFFEPDSTNPLRWVYISGGVDDVLGIYERDFFVGAGVRFTDDNLRGLVGFIPLN